MSLKVYVQVSFPSGKIKKWEISEIIITIVTIIPKMILMIIIIVLMDNSNYSYNTNNNKKSNSGSNCRIFNNKK